jgi:hypothetical protein
MDQNTKLLESILATQVLILEQHLKKESGVKRIGGDFIQEAVDLVVQKEERIVALLHQRLRS